MEVLFILVIIGAIIAVTASKASKAVTEAWSEAARRLDLRFQAGRTKAMRGSRPNLQLLVKVKHVGKSQWTEYVARFAKALPLQIRLSPQGIFSDVTNPIFNRVDIKIGDSTFDSGITIEGSDPQQVREFLDPEVVRSIKRLVGRFDQFEIDRQGVTVLRSGVSKNVEMLTKDVELLEKIALFLIHKGHSLEHLDDMQKPESPQPPPVPKEESSDEELPDRKPPPLPGKEQSSEHEGSSHEEVGEAEIDLAEAPAAEPLEEEIIEEAAAEPVENSEIEVSNQKETQPEATQKKRVSSPLVEDWITQFSEAQGRYEFSKIFDTFWKDQDVRGEAILSSVETFSMDRVFGRGPGLRLQFDLGELENGEELQLVSNAPETAQASALRDHVGTQVPFEGSLIRCDAFSQTLFLQVPSLEESE